MMALGFCAKEVQDTIADKCTVETVSPGKSIYRLRVNVYKRYFPLCCNSFVEFTNGIIQVLTTMQSVHFFKCMIYSAANKKNTAFFKNLFF